MAFCVSAAVACTGALPARDAALPGDDAGGATGADAADADDGTGDASDAGDAADAGGATDAADAASDATPSICTSGQPVTPVSTVAAYSQATWYCLSRTAPKVCDNSVLVQRLLACDAVAVRAYFGLVGTDFLQVTERRPSSCVLSFWEAVEGLNTFWTCELPLPHTAWAGLSVPSGTAGFVIPNKELPQRDRVAMHPGGDLLHRSRVLHGRVRFGVRLHSARRVQLT